MKIKKILNNNVIIAKDPYRGEIILMGTGIGFQTKIGEHVQNDRIQKIFVLKDHSKLSELIDKIPASYLELTEKLVAYAQKQYGLTLNENIYLSLTDHIYFALQRIKEHIPIDNPFLLEVKQFYQEEYQIGIYAKKLIYEMYSLTIPEEEIGYIAMHMIENAHYRQKRDVSKTLEVADAVLSFIKESYLKDINENELSYTRLTNHVKHFAKRYVENQESRKEDQLLLKTMKEVFEEEAVLIEQLSLYLKTTFGEEIQDPEKYYLILHLRNCKELH